MTMHPLASENTAIASVPLPDRISDSATLLGLLKAFGFILTGVLAFGLATGGLFPLIGLKLQEQGASDLVIGMITSVFLQVPWPGRS